MSKPNDARAKWDATFADNVNISDLRASVRRAPQLNPCIQGYRSVCWKIFLLFQTLDRNAWTKTIRDSRSAYGSLKDHLLQDLEASQTSSSSDPLADNSGSKLQASEDDEALRAEILQDVERCMPEIAFFRESIVQAMLLNVLFVYCKINADLGYRQGMHELLAPVLWVTYQDASSLREMTPKSDSDKLMFETLDIEYVEHDSFSLFCIMMQTAKSFYEMTAGTQQQPLRSRNDSPIVERSRRIHEEYLHKTDPELASHLTAIDILPQIFIIRWIRLLFGREFAFEDVLSLWDMIFAEDPSLTLVDHICLAMLLRVRWQLLGADYSSALTLLLRYPEPKPPNHASTLVGDAVYLSKHMDLQGGSAIIRKYTGKAPLAALAQAGGEMVKRKGSHAPQSSVDLQKALSPLRSSAEYIQNQGGIEAMLQGAAKNVYSRSEQWGLNKAIRGAVQNFQQNHGSLSSPPRGSHPHQQHASRWSLDEGRVVRTTPIELDRKIKAMAERNQGLARMLDGAIGELVDQAKTLEQQHAEASATALTLTIAKLQYLQVYLQDPQMPLEPDFAKSSSSSRAEGSEGSPIPRSSFSPRPPAARDAPPSPTPRPRAELASPPRLPERRGGKSPVPITLSGPSQPDLRTRTPVQTPTAASTAAAATAANVGADSPADPMPPSAPPPTARLPSGAVSPRPSLADPSYSWMLGDEGSRSSLAASSPGRHSPFESGGGGGGGGGSSSSNGNGGGGSGNGGGGGGGGGGGREEREREKKHSAARSKAGFLFGDQDNAAGPSSEGSPVRRKLPARKAKAGIEAEGDGRDADAAAGLKEVGEAAAGGGGGGGGGEGGGGGGGEGGKLAGEGSGLGPL